MKVAGHWVQYHRASGSLAFFTTLLLSGEDDPVGEDELVSNHYIIVQYVNILVVANKNNIQVCRG